MLIEQDAVKIYELKIKWTKAEISKGNPRTKLRGKSGAISRLFGVSSRTVRDIWNRQTWAHATKGLWSQESEIEMGAIESIYSIAISSDADNLVYTR